MFRFPRARKTAVEMKGLGEFGPRAVTVHVLINCFFISLGELFPTSQVSIRSAANPRK